MSALFADTTLMTLQKALDAYSLRHRTIAHNTRT